jgi:ABC-2 type transport system permease protein
MTRVAGEVQGIPYAIFALPGVAVMAMIGSVLSAATRTFNERFSQVLQEYLSLPATRQAYILAKMTVTLLLAVVHSLIFLGFGGALFRLSPPGQGLLLGLLVLFLAAATLTGAFLGLALWLRDMGIYLAGANILAQVLIWSGGLFYPLEAMPGFLRILGLVNPLTHAATLLRQTLIAPLNPSSLESWIYLSFVAVLSGSFALYSLQNRLKL